jgi:hypothetical protein
MDELINRFNHLYELKITNKVKFCKMIGITRDTLDRFREGKRNLPEKRSQIEKGIKTLEGTQNAEKDQLLKKIQAEGPMEDGLIEMARVVLRSGTPEAAALHANIVAFFTSLGRSGGSSHSMPIQDPQEKGPGGSS